VRRADSTEAIGNALVAKAHRGRVPDDRCLVQAARVDGPPMAAGRAGATRTVAVPAGVEHAVAVDRELLVRPAPQRTTLGHGLNLLAGAALCYRDRFGVIASVWALIGFLAQGRLLAPPHPRCS
jgi:hypothetical protein